MRLEKKKKEEEDLELFFQLLGEDDDKRLENEAPDFDVEINGSKIGIELTNYKLSKKHSDLVLSVKSTMKSVEEIIEGKINSQFDKRFLINYSLRKPIPRIIRKTDKLKIIDFLTNHLNLREVQNVLP